MHWKLHLIHITVIDVVLIKVIEPPFVIVCLHEYNRQIATAPPTKAHHNNQGKQLQVTHKPRQLKLKGPVATWHRNSGSWAEPMEAAHPVHVCMQMWIDLELFARCMDFHFILLHFTTLFPTTRVTERRMDELSP